jgi:DNA-binding transcriptional MerR regulator
VTARPDLAIGDFARRTRLPVSTLRYYDKIGLLVPAAVDPHSGYRRYTVEQLPAATLIAELRAIGMIPEQIRQILAGGESGSTALDQERRRLRVEITQRRRALARLHELYPARWPRPTPTFVDRPAVRVAVEEFVAPVADVEPGVLRAVARLRGRMRRAGLGVAGPWGATFPLTVEEEIRGFAFAPVEALTGVDGGESDRRGAPLDVRWLGARPSVRVEHHGGAATLRGAYRAVFAAIDDAGLDPGEPVIEEYRGPDVIRIEVPYARSTG